MVLKLISLISMASHHSSTLFLVNLIFLLSLIMVTTLVSRGDARKLGKPTPREENREMKLGNETGRKMVNYFSTTNKATVKNLGDMKNLPPFPLIPFPPFPPFPEIPFPPPLVFPGIPPLPPFPMFPPLPPFHIPTIPFLTPPPP